MPYNERDADNLRRDLAETPEDKARVEGYIEGRRDARKEELAWLVSMVLLAVIIFVL